MSESLARHFHEIYERLAPQFGYETRTETREFDPDSPNGMLMIAVCGVIDGMFKFRLAEVTQERDAYMHASDVACDERDENKARLAEAERDAARWRFFCNRSPFIAAAETAAFDAALAGEKL